MKIKFYTLIALLFTNFPAHSCNVNDLDNGEMKIQRSVESYLKENSEYPFLIIGCGHFTPNEKHESFSPVHDQSGNLIEYIKTNYYSGDLCDRHDFHQHPGAYTVNKSLKDSAGGNINCDLVGFVGNKIVDNYLFSKPVWKFIYPETVGHSLLTF